MTSDESVGVKGSPVRSLQKFIETTLTSEQRQSLLDRLPPEYASRLVTPIQSSETIPVHMLNRFTEEAALAAGIPLEDFARRAGREAASEAISGMYRFFATVLTPPVLLAKASSMWKALYDRGELLVEEQSPTFARIRLVHFPSERAGCYRMAGWIERLAELSGAHHVVVTHSTCVANGDAWCEWEVRWEA